MLSSRFEVHLAREKWKGKLLDVYQEKHGPGFGPEQRSSTSSYIRPVALLV